jgi:hypothetical protein
LQYRSHEHGDRDQGELWVIALLTRDCIAASTPSK